MTGQLLTTEQAAGLLQLAPITLRKMRLAGNGPPFVKIGSAVRYRRDRLDEWVTARETGHTSQPRTR